MINTNKFSKRLYVIVVLLALINMVYLNIKAHTKLNKRVQEIEYNTIVIERINPVFKDMSIKYNLDYSFLVVYSYMTSGLLEDYSTTDGYGLMSVNIPVKTPEINLEYFIKHNNYFKDGYVLFLKKSKTIDYNKFNEYYKFLSGKDLE